MFVWKRRVSHFESRMDASIERFIFHHRLLGLLLIFVGMPLAILTAIFTCTTIIVLPIALAFGLA